RSSSGAECDRWARRPWRPWPLQWSRSSSGAECGGELDPLVLDVRASMEPLLFRSGMRRGSRPRSAGGTSFNGAAPLQERNADALDGLEDLLDASMEPLLFRSGMLATLLRER